MRAWPVAPWVAAFLLNLWGSAAWGAETVPPPRVVPPRAVEVPTATYPPQALEDGLEADVLLELDVAADGLVTAVSVVTPVGHGFDEAAVAAVRGMGFEPATVDGEPTAVRIRYTYRFTIEEKVIEPPAPPPPPPVVARGVVVERGTRRRLGGVPVVVESTGGVFLTDSLGRFELRAPGAGPWILEITLPGYDPFRRTLRLAADGPAALRLGLTRDIYAGHRTVIEEPVVPKEVSKKRLTVPEIQKIPGNSGDAIKVIQTLPGVARGVFGGGRPIVRGSGPRDTIVYLEGQVMPQLFHFGGVYSVINTDLLESVDFWPGGFGPRHGYALGGLIDVKLRQPKTDRLHGILETNAIHTSLLVEGPLGDRTAFAASVRRSYIDAVLAAVLPEDTLEFVVAPRYYDYQVHLTHVFNRRHRISMLLYGTDDRLEFVIDKPDGPSPDFHGLLTTRFDFHLLTGTWTWDMAPDMTLQTSWRGGYNGGNVSLGEAFFVDIDVKPIDLRSELIWELSEDHVLTAGLHNFVWTYDVDLFVPPPPKEGELHTPPDPADFQRQTVHGEPVWALSPYVESALRLSPAWSVAPGLRVDILTGKGFGYVAFDPRLTTRWAATETTTLKAQAGIYHQAPQEDEYDEVFGNQDLGPERGVQVSAGFEHKLTDDVHVDIQGFAKWMDDLVVRVDPIERGVPYTNEGIGRVFGLEFMVRHDPTGRFFGWLSYTLLRAERRDQPDAPWRPFSFDQTHILNAVGVVQLGAGWEAGLRFRYATGNPWTPIVGSVFDSDQDIHIPVFGTVNSGRLGAFHQLDVRVDKKWVFDDWMLDLFLEVQNAYMQANPEALAYSYDYTESTPITGIPILPNFGLRADF